MNITLLFVSGQQLQTSQLGLLHLLKSKYVIPYYAVSLIYITIVDLYYFLTNLPPRFIPMVNLFIIIATVIAFILYVQIVCFIQKRRSKIVKLNVSVLFIASNITVGLILLYYTKIGLGVKLNTTNFVLIMINNFLITEINLFIFATYSIENFKKTNADLHFSLDTNLKKYITLYGKKVDPSSIIYIKSDDAYLSIKTIDQSLHIRGNLADAAKQLDEQGFIPHRSYWVNIKHIHSVTSENSKYDSIVMSDKTVIPVAKARSLLVAEMLKEIII